MLRPRWHKLCLGLVLGLATTPELAGCKKKAPPDPHVAEGYRLLDLDAHKALEQFELARDKQAPLVLLGQALAYEGLREYAKAEGAFEKVRPVADGPALWFPRARVRLMLGKADEARRDIDAVTAQSQSDLSALLLEVCLAHDKNRAAAALNHLDAWPAQRKSDGKLAGLPAEYHMARAVLLRQLGDPEKARLVDSEANAVGFTSETLALGLATVAYRADRRDLSLGVLDRLANKSLDTTILRQAALLSHAQGAHALTEKALGKIPEGSNEGEPILRLRAEHDFATNPALATTRLRRAIAATTDLGASAQLELMLAESLLRAGDGEQARAVLDKLLKKQPKLEGAHLALARMDLIAGKLPFAIARLSPLVAQGGSLAALELLARAELAAQQFDHARLHLQDLVKRAPHDHRALAGLVSLEIRQKHRQAALDLIEERIKGSPKDPEWWLLLASTLHELGAGPQAETAALRRGITALPKEPRLWLALAGGPQSRDRKAALATLEQAEKLNPGSLAIAAAIATLHGQLGHAAQALAYYEKVLRFAENDVGALNNAAMLYADDLHAPDKAVALAERAHQLAPSHPAVTDTLGWALYRRGSKDDIVRARELLESVKDQLTSPTSKYHLGVVLIAAGAPLPGKQLLRAALAMSQDFPEATEAQKALGSAP